MLIDTDFFDQPLDQSKVKSTIVTNFFTSWSKVMLGAAQHSGRSQRLAYYELFCGPGRYRDGAKSTPLMIMEQIIATSGLRENMEATFIDIDKTYIAALKAELEALPGYGTVRRPARLLCDEVNPQTEAIFTRSEPVPTLSFIDPFGYRGLSINLIHSISKTWGSDCIFFFNYRRVNAALNNDNFINHMGALFEADRAEIMRREVRAMSPSRRLNYILSKLDEVLKKHGLRYNMIFKFSGDKSKRTTHALVFVTKDIKGYKIMKDVMASASSTHSQDGVPSYEFCPEVRKAQPELDLVSEVSKLAEQLACKYSGRRMIVQDVVDGEQPTRFVDKNIKDALCMLEKSGCLTAVPPAASRWRAGRLTCGPKVLLTFAQPPIGEIKRAA
jgi:three-Cys-motif partner protein